MTVALHSNGCIVKKSSSSIGKIKKVSGPEMTTTKVEDTDLNMTDWVRTFQPGLIDPGDMTVEVFYNASDRSTLLTDFFARTVATYGAFYSGGTNFTGPGFIQKINSADVEIDGVMMTPVTIACTAKWA